MDCPLFPFAPTHASRGSAHPAPRWPNPCSEPLTVNRDLCCLLLALCPLAVAVVLAGCRLTDAFVREAPPEEQGRPLECEKPNPAPSEDVAEPTPAQESEPSPPASARTDLPRGDIRESSRSVSVGGQTVAVTLLDVPLGSFTPKVGLAKDHVGATESLAGIARRLGAVAAINGSFFDAYSNRPVRTPYHNLVVEGRLVSLSDHPTTLGVWPDGTVAIGQVKFRLEGDSGHPDPWLRRWYAYGLNQYPERETCATFFDSHWALTRSPDHGLFIVVRNGHVTAKGHGPTDIPADGYVLYLRGGETQLDKRFEVGQQCSYRVVAESSDGLDWLSAKQALGCGPLLLRDDQPSVNPQAERFRDPKVLTGSHNRSALGLTADGHLLLVTTSSATIPALAQVMQTLGCRDAMNLDGGASSGLFLRDAYLTKPGRDISNALLVMAR